MLSYKAREILANTSTRFGHFHEVLLAMEGRADANELRAEILLLRAIRTRSYRILQSAGLNHMLTMAVLRDRLPLPGAGITHEIIKGDGDVLRLVKSTGSDPFGGANGPTSRDRGRPARRAPRFVSPGKGGLCSQVGASRYAPTLGHAGRPPQCRGVQRYPRRVLTFHRPRLDICGWVRDSSNLALWWGVRLHLTSCGRG